MTVKKLCVSLCMLLPFYLSQSNATGNFFDVSLNNKIINIKTTIHDHTYPAAGIMITNPEYHLTNPGKDCTMNANGYCLFSVSDTSTKKISFTGPRGKLSFILCLDGAGPFSCQNYTINYFNAALYGATGQEGANPRTLYKINLSTGNPSFVMSLPNGNMGQSIASDGKNLYHWAYGLFERINLDNLTTTEIPSYSGFFEVTGSVYYHNAGAFLTTNFEDMYTNTIAGSVSFVGSNSEDYIVRGMACYKHKVYGILNSNIVPIKYILRMDPDTGQVLSQVPITLAGFTVNRGFALTVSPDTGQFYAILGVEEDSIRRLVKIDVNTGVATDPLDASGGIGLRLSSIAFQPADPDC